MLTEPQRPPWDTAETGEDQRFEGRGDWRLNDAERHAMLTRLQRNGAALSSCECGSRHWLPPDSLYRLVPIVRQTNSAPLQSSGRIVVPLTCAACGFTKLYDPAVAGAIP